mmetsp:Transcript_30337/g.79533  ORF Transcript_30337/g.79533 Transcript_30337/m.79533 type:complete len:341 (+) Transcript_30337:55-1077(+)
MPAHHDLLIGVLMTLAGAALLAFSMVTQRYALAHPATETKHCGRQCSSVPVAGILVPRSALWFIGLVIYGCANAFKVIAFRFGPQSVLASVFSTLLIFNLVFARCVLGESVTGRKLAGSAVILTGAVLCVVGAPSDVKTDFDVAAWTLLMQDYVGAVYVAIMGALVLSGLWLTCRIEGRYPWGGETGEVPVLLDHQLKILYPAALGLDEAFADLLIKGWSAMLAHTSSFRYGIFYVAVILWILASFGSAFWFMRVVVRRYEATVALPVEYGTLNAAAVLTGLLFYKEHASMSVWQLASVLSGAFVIVVGILLGQTPGPPTPDFEESRKSSDQAASTGSEV